MSTTQLVSAGTSAILNFCCQEVSDGGATMNPFDTGISVPINGNYAVKFGCVLSWDTPPTDFTFSGLVDVLFSSSTGVVYGGIGSGINVVGQGYFEINTHIAPMTAGDQVTVLVTNASAANWTIDNYYLEVAYRGIQSAIVSCEGGGGG